MTFLFKELNFPELVSNCRKIYDEHIEPLSVQQVPIMKTEGILSVFSNNNTLEINKIRKQYPFLSKHLYIFKMRPGFKTYIHLDGHDKHMLGKRDLSLNIPISGCNSLSTTEFFNIPEKDFYLEPKFNVRVTKPDIEIPPPSYTYYLKDNPFIVNPQTPHRANNELNDVYRISLSWTINSKWKLDEILEFVN
jgi:hypothetical protein